MAAAMDQQFHMSLSVYRAGEKFRYLSVGQSGAPEALAWVKNDCDATLFLRSLGVAAENIEAITMVESLADVPWLPPHETVIRPMRLPSAALIERGRLPGILDWRDPVVWKPLLAGVAILAVVWMLGSFALVWAKQQAVDEALVQARKGGEEVLHARSVVDALSLKLSAIDALEHQQRVPMLLLNRLSNYLPEDVWLHSLYLKPDVLEIKGQGKNAAALAGQLEKMPELEKVSYIGDIRPDPATHDQLFGMALYLRGKQP